MTITRECRYERQRERENAFAVKQPCPQRFRPAFVVVQKRREIGSVAGILDAVAQRQQRRHDRLQKNLNANRPSGRAAVKRHAAVTTAKLRSICNRFALSIFRHGVTLHGGFADGGTGMSGSRWIAKTALAGLSVSMAAPQTQATEAAAGRYLPGMFALPGAGIVPPFPGFYYGMSNALYVGDASANIPFGDNVIAAGVDATMWTTALAGIYVPQQDLPGNWTYAFQGVLPIGWMETDAQVGLIERTDEMAGLGDIQITPLLFGWHNATGNTFFSASFTITAPTGAWEADEIAFVGLNYWSLQPAVAFTHITADGWDFSGKFGIDINTENEDSDYYSGAMAHLDLAVTKSVTEQLQIGAIAGFLYQFEDDESTFADTRPDGFKGRSVAVGPLIKYKAKFDEREIDFSLSWAHEVETKNRMEGDAVFFNISGKF